MAYVRRVLARSACRDGNRSRGEVLNNVAESVVRQENTRWRNQGQSARGTNVGHRWLDHVGGEGMNQLTRLALELQLIRVDARNDPAQVGDVVIEDLSSQSRCARARHARALGGHTLMIRR